MADSGGGGAVLESKDADFTRLSIVADDDGDGDEGGVVESKGSEGGTVGGGSSGAGAGAGAGAGDAAKISVDDGAGDGDGEPNVIVVTSDDVGGETGDGGAPAVTDSMYTFEPVKSFVPSYTKDSDLKSKVKQWNLDALMQVKRFRFHQKFDIKQLNAFMVDFFNSPTVRGAFQVMGVGKQPVKIAGNATDVTTQRVPATVLTMEFWDRCVDDDVITSSGYIRKCLEEVYDGATVGDELRKMFVDEDSEHVDLYEDAEKDEFMYRMMRAITIGGPLCQYDDRWDDYVKFTKGLYKDLLTVYKDADTEEIRVSSLIFNVTKVGGLSTPLFPRDNMHNFCYVVVDSLKRQATVWYGGYIPFW